MVGSDVKSSLRNEFTKRNFGILNADVAKNKVFAELKAELANELNHLDFLLKPKKG